MNVNGAHPMHDHHEDYSDYEQMNPDDWCYVHMVEKLECVHCQFGADDLIFMFACERCRAPDTESFTWGWRAPDGQELCVRCMAIGAYQDIATHEMRMPQFPNSMHCVEVAP